MRHLRLLLLTTFLLLLTILPAYASVSLESFTGSWAGDEVTLEFSTGSEIDHAGFHVWRSATNLAPEDVNSTTATRLTSGLIIGGSACTATGFDYTYVDTTIDNGEDVYYYYLESIACGTADPTFYGDLQEEGSGLVIANPGEPALTTLYLPLIQVLNPEP